MKALLVVAATFGVGACTSLPGNVALQKVDHFREVQNACLEGHVAQFDDGVSEAAKIGHFVAMSCTVETDRLVQYAVPHATAAERQGFQRDAALRATGYVLRARAQPKS